MGGAFSPIEGGRGGDLGPVDHEFLTRRIAGDGAALGGDGVNALRGVDVAGGEAVALAQRNAGGHGLNGGQRGFRKAELAVMHDGVVSVGAEVDAEGELLGELAPIDGADVWIEDPDMSVTVLPGLGMPESDDVADFVNDRTRGTAAVGNIDELLAADHAYAGIARRDDVVLAETDIVRFGSARD